MRLLYIFPIKENQLIFNSYRGSQYACNPKYISEKLLQLYSGKFEIIWAFNEPEKFDFLKKQGIKVIKFNSFKRFYYEATSKISINNVGSFSWLPLRKGQEHINTWHSGLDLTSCGMNEPENDKLTRYSIGLSAKETTLFLSANRLFSEYSLQIQFNYKGTLLECGLPRSDDLINRNLFYLRNTIREKLQIAQDTIVIMYSPTWRYGGANAMPHMDYYMISQAMKKRFGENFVVLNRSHHLSSNTTYKGIEYVIDVTSYPNIEELVMISDIMISDYSSVMWDGALADIAIIQYTPDAEQYDKERGFYVPIGKWCLPVAYSLMELCKIIQEINLDTCKSNSKNLLKTVGSLETGEASLICCYWIADKCGIDNAHFTDYQKYIHIANELPNASIINKMSTQSDALWK